MSKVSLAALFLSALFCASPLHAGRPALDGVRAQLMRLHVRLYSEAVNSPQVVEARRIAGEAYSEMYKHREEVLTKLYQTSDYADVRLALYHTQRRLAGVHEEIPVRVQKIMDTATDVLAVRVRLTQLEADALEADPGFVESRDTANALNAAFRQTLRESLAAIRTNPELVALCDQFASMQQSITGNRSVVSQSN